MPHNAKPYQINNIIKTTNHPNNPHFPSIISHPKALDIRNNPIKIGKLINQKSFILDRFEFSLDAIVVDPSNILLRPTHRETLVQASENYSVLLRSNAFAFELRRNGSSKKTEGEYCCVLLRSNAFAFELRRNGPSKKTEANKSIHFSLRSRIIF